MAFSGSGRSTRRIMALWFPRLPTDRLKRASPYDGPAERGQEKWKPVFRPAARPKDRPKENRDRNFPLVVSAKADNALYIYALEARAEALRLYQGQALATARAMVQDLHIVPADEKADAALLACIADWCGRFTPLVGLDSPRGLLLDITGAAHLFGGEATMLEQALAKIGAQGFTVRGAIAGTSLAARALARYAPRSPERGQEFDSDSVSNGEAVAYAGARQLHPAARQNNIVPVGGDAAAIAALPIAAFECNEKTARALLRAGLKTVAQVANRDRRELSERLGKEFVARLDIMLGREEQPIVPLRPLPDLMAEQRFAEPVTARDTIAASLRHLAESLCKILERQGRGLRMLEAAFFRADGKVERIAVKTGTPLREPEAMLRLLHERLDALADPLDPGFGFDLVRLEARLAETMRPAAIGFDAAENAGREIEFLIDRLTARFGEHRVQHFISQDTHIPEAAGIAVPAQAREFTGGAWRKKRETGDPPRRPLRLFEKPEEIAAGLATPPDGAPKFFRWRQCRHDVVRAEGPERIAMEWWRKQRPTRDYFRVETRQGQRFWLYRDGLYTETGPGTRWYLQGIFA
jgi:protein ImuB